MIAVGVGVDQGVDDLGGVRDPAHGREHFACVCLVEEGVDEQAFFTVDDEPGVGQPPASVWLQIRIGAVRDLDQTFFVCRHITPIVYSNRALEPPLTIMAPASPRKM